MNRQFHWVFVSAIFCLMAGLAWADTRLDHAPPSLDEIRKATETDPKHALVQLEALYSTLEFELSGEQLTDIALLWAELYRATADHSGGENRLQSLLAKHQPKLNQSQRLRIELAVIEFIRRSGRNPQALSLLEGMEADMLALLNDMPHLVAEWQLSRGSTLHNLAQYELALQDYLESLRQFERLEDTSRQALTLNRMGITLLRAEDPDNALSYFQRAEQLLTAAPDAELELSVLANLGIAYQRLEQIEAAIESYERGLLIAEAANRPLAQAQALLNIGTIYFNDDQPEVALTYYQRSLDIAERSGIEYGMLLNRMNIGQVYIDLGDYANAERMIEAALEQAQQADLKLELRQIYGLLTDLYRAMGDFENLVLAQDAYITLSEDIFTESRDQALSELRLQYDNELQEEQLRTQEAEIARQRSRNRLLSIIVALSLSTIAVGLWGHVSRIRSLRTLYERNRDLVDCQFGPQPRLGPDRNLVDSKEADSDTSQTTDQLRPLYETLRALMHQQALYRDPSLSVAKLAALCHSNRNYVSAAVSRFGRGNFNQFVNGFRVNEARRLLASERPTPPISVLMERCGFSSRSAFYQVFKREVGMTPSQYRDMALKDNIPN